MEGDGPIVGRWDASRLEQVITNLVSNALRYSPGDGRVRVRASADAARATLEVSDQGIGIPAQQLGQLFTPFFRAANATRVERGGLGLGLYITHEIVRRHGGELRVASTEGKGTTFTVELPRGDIRQLDEVRQLQSSRREEDTMGELTDKIKGKVKQVEGVITGDRVTQKEGELDEAKGNVKEKFEDLKRAVRPNK